MTPLTIQIITRNNGATIEPLLQSLLPLQAEIIVADAGSNDNTLSICKSYGLPIMRVSASNQSSARNELVAKSKHNWQFYIEPWENILSGQDQICHIVEQNSAHNYHLEVMQDDIITKEVRLWRRDSGIKFNNPVFESLQDNNSLYAHVLIWSVGDETDNSNSLQKWRKSRPLAIEPYYYEACAALLKRDYTQFVTLADHYIFQHRRPTVSSTMIRYYLGLVQCCVLQNLQASIQNAIQCLAEHPLMAEFWCLLGDAFLENREFAKAKTFYDNALLLGSRRLREDRWPMQVSKYDQYPKDMIVKCQEALESVKRYPAHSQ